jgi:hypothetical protein
MRLTPYGSNQHALNLAKVGKSKTPQSLASRMPSPEIAAKVGSPTVMGIGARSLRVVRRSAKV